MKKEITVDELLKKLDEMKEILNKKLDLLYEIEGSLMFSPDEAKSKIEKLYSMPFPEPLGEFELLSEDRKSN